MEKIIDRPVLAIMFFTVIILLGVYSFNNMTIGLVPDPDEQLPSLTVEYSWTGVSPDVILKEVLIPAENEIMQVKGVEKMSSRALIGNGFIRVEFNRNVKMNFAHLVLREKMNRLQRDLPPAVQLPVIRERVPDNFEQQPLMGIGIYAENYSVYQLKKIAERDIQPQLSGIPGVEEAILQGGVDPEIKINTGISRLKKFDLSIADIYTQISRHFYSKQSVSFQKEGGEITLSLSETPDRISDIQNICLRKTGQKTILLKEVADVYLGYQEMTYERRYQGKPFLSFSIYKDRSFSHLDVAERVRTQLKSLADKFAAEISFIIQSDESKELKNQLTQLSKIAYAILLIILVILLVVVRDIKASFLIFSSVFFSVFATFTVIYLLEIDLNILTLSGLALGFGLFVDNAVVVFDSILRYREKGFDRKTASVEGAKSVVMPVMASTLTTIIVFFSFALFFKDRLKMFYLPLAYIIAISLISSLVVSFVLIPSLTARLNLKIKRKSGPNGKFFSFFLKYALIFVIPVFFVFFSLVVLLIWGLSFLLTNLIAVIVGSLFFSVIFSFILLPAIVSRLRSRKERDPGETLFKKGRFFPFILKYPLIVIIPIILLLIFSTLTFLEEVTFGSFFSWFSRDRVIVWLRFPSGAEFEDVSNAIDKFEKVALEKTYQKEINTTISSRVAFMSITFPEEIENSAYPLQLKQELVGIATNLAGIGVNVSGFDQEPYYYNPDTGSSMPYNIHIKGYNFEKLMAVANELRNNLLTHRRIKDCEIQTDKESWWGGKEKYFSLKINREKLEKYSMPPDYLMYLISSNLIERQRAQTLKFDDKELSIEIKSPDVKDIELDDLLGMELSFGPIPFRLRDVVDIEFTTQRGGITRENQEYWAMVQWDYLGSAKSGDRYHKTIYNNLQVPVGFSKSLDERRWRLSEEEEGQLMWAMIISAGLILLILGILYESFFQPFLIFLAVPLALIGVFIAFWRLDYSFDSAAYIGVILLMGIVVNNAILLIDNINRHVKETNRIIESIAVATKERIRPILMTTLTTVLGMLPLLLIHKGGAKGDIWTNLALCTVGGLTTSALLILLVLPIFYYQFYKFQVFLGKSKTSIGAAAKSTAVGEEKPAVTG